MFVRKGNGGSNPSPSANNNANFLRNTAVYTEFPVLIRRPSSYLKTPKSTRFLTSLDEFWTSQ